jgi:adenylate cyclase class IV
MAETLRHPPYQGNRPTDGGQTVNFKRQQPSSRRKIRDIYFSWKLRRLWDLSADIRIRSIQKSNDSFRNRSREEQYNLNVQKIVVKATIFTHSNREMPSKKSCLRSRQLI